MKAMCSLGPDSWTGQGLVEYGLILSLMAAVAVLTLVFFGSEVSTVLNIIARAVDTPG